MFCFANEDSLGTSFLSNSQFVSTGDIFLHRTKVMGALIKIEPRILDLCKALVILLRTQLFLISIRLTTKSLAVSDESFSLNNLSFCKM